MNHERYRVEVNGIVQGVGFRPFVYKLATALSLRGIVKNTAGGVWIEVEGTPEALGRFMQRLTGEAPPLSVIQEVKLEKLEYIGYKDFTILESSGAVQLNTLVSPDISICTDCSRELFDPSDYRYRYPFINCTHCGPRFTILSDIPYDRKNTTMKPFDLCPVCGGQYGDPMDRRYHAQPVCCSICGPELSLLDAGGNAVNIGDCNDENDKYRLESDKIKSSRILEYAATLLANGKILAVKGLGGYHLVCDASNAAAVGELRKRKYRDEKPFALMARDLDTVLKYCDADETEINLLITPAKPIVLLPQKPGTGLPEQLAPGNPNLGMMLPYTPVHLLLFFKRRGEPSVCPELLVMTSGNRSDEPICFKDDEAVKRLQGIADYFLTNNREIRTRTDDSVVRAFKGGAYFIRRSRGYVPVPVTAAAGVLPENPPMVLAVGGELKNTFCLTKGNHFFVSHHIGDLENMETLQAFEDGIEHFKRLFDIAPGVVAHDMHPGYLSTGYAASLNGVVKIPVQHHHAHIASCMLENNLSGDVIGVAFDGTGYGEDGTIWGGEFFTGSYDQFERAAYLENFLLPGSEAAVKEPWRTAAACLYQCGYDLGGGSLHGLHVPEERLAFVAGMLEKGVNSPPTSSMGRLFDAVAALAGIRNISNFEGQAAMDLEFAAAGYSGAPYRIHVEKGRDGAAGNKVYRIGIKGIVDGILEDLDKGMDPGFISARFHETVAVLVEETCMTLREDKGLERVVLSGGVFQNMRLLSACMDKLHKRGFQPFIHRQVPANDGGISLGQAAIAMARYRMFC